MKKISDYSDEEIAQEHYRRVRHPRSRIENAAARVRGVRCPNEVTDFSQRWWCWYVSRRMPWIVWC